MNRVNQALNRLGGILVWVGLWNVLVMAVSEENLAGNVIYSLIGGVLWFLTGEFKQRTLTDILEIPDV